MKVEIHFVKEASVISDSSHSSQKFMHGIRVLMAKNYTDNLSEEAKKGMRRMILNPVRMKQKVRFAYSTVSRKYGRSRFHVYLRRREKAVVLPIPNTASTPSSIPKLLIFAMD